MEEVIEVKGKVCTKCGTFKEFSEFNSRKDTKDGYQSWCKVCKSIQNKANYVKVEPLELPNHSNMYKTCSHCKQEKWIYSFSWKNKSKGLFRSECRECVKEKYYTGEAKEKNILRAKKYRLENKDKIREYKSRPEVIKAIEEYNSRSDIIERKREYNSRSDIIERKKEYNSRPEIIAKSRKYRQTEEYRSKSIIYEQNYKSRVMKCYMKSILVKKAVMLLNKNCCMNIEC